MTWKKADCKDREMRALWGSEVIKNNEQPSTSSCLLTFSKAWPDSYGFDTVAIFINIHPQIPKDVSPNMICDVWNHAPKTPSIFSFSMFALDSLESAF